MSTSRTAFNLRYTHVESSYVQSIHAEPADRLTDPGKGRTACQDPDNAWHPLGLPCLDEIHRAC